MDNMIARNERIFLLVLLLIAIGALTMCIVRVPHDAQRETLKQSLAV